MLEISNLAYSILRCFPLPLLSLLFSVHELVVGSLLGDQAEHKHHLLLGDVQDALSLME